MRGLHKSKRVSWASDFNLCQVRLFLSEESPSLVGLSAQDHLQAKTSWLLHSTGTGSDDSLPPGFEGGHPISHLQINLSQIPVNSWRCPPMFMLSMDWQVVAGEESHDAGVQSQREMRVLEAVYPRPSSIPPNSSGPTDLKDTEYDDQKTPSIPITAIEDEDVTPDTPSDPPLSFNSPITSQGIPFPSQLSVPKMALPSNDQGNLIDHELLIKILSDPKMIEKLVTDVGTAGNTQNIPKQISPPVALAEPPPPPPFHISRTENGAPISTPLPCVPFSNSRVHVSSFPSTSAPPQAKDFNYYKSLIQQHGGERQEAPPLQYGNHYNHQPGSSSQETVNNNQNLRDQKPRIMKPCLYFNSSRGCRHGVNCAYQHDGTIKQQRSSSSGQELSSAKRMKMDREISG